MSSTSEPSNASVDGTIPEPPITRSAQDNLKMSAMQTGFMIAASVILNTLVLSISGLKTSYLYKDVLQLSASQVASLGIIIGIPAYLRPFMGAGADLFSMFGFHRRSYYCLSWLVYAAGLLGLGFSESYHVAQVVTLAIVSGAGANLLFVIMDSVMVSVGNNTGLIGRLQSVQQGLPLIMGLTFASVLGGYVAGHWSYSACFITSGLLAVAGSLITLLINETPVGHHHDHHPNTLHERHLVKTEDVRDTRAHALILKKALLSPGLWIAAFYVFYLIITPGTNTAQFYYTVNVLHFSPLFLGKLGAFGNAGAIIGILLFLAFSKKAPTAYITWGAFIGDLITYPILLGLHNRLSAEVVTFVVSVTGIIYTLCLLTFAARACPPGVEATIYAIFMAMTSLGGTLGEKIGSSIYDYYGPAHQYSTAHGWHILLCVGAVLTALAALVIPFLPKWAKDTQVHDSAKAALQH